MIQHLPLCIYYKWKGYKQSRKYSLTLNFLQYSFPKRFEIRRTVKALFMYFTIWKIYVSLFYFDFFHSPIQILVPDLEHAIFFRLIQFWGFIFLLIIFAECFNNLCYFFFDLNLSTPLSFLLFRKFF